MKINYKNIIALTFFIFALTSCWSNNIEVWKTKSNVKYDTFVVWWSSLKSRILEWNILSNNSISKTSSIAWKITKLNCEVWNLVYPKTLIATISPDFTNPNIKWLVTTKNSLDLQLWNLKWIKLSTINNLDTQISTLESTISSSEDQLKLSKQNYDLLFKQKWLTSSDLASQLSTLEDQLTNLTKQKDLLDKSKKDELEKLNISLNNLKITSYNNISDILLYIDKLYWITEENKDKNDNFENYLSAKNTSLKSKITNSFRNLNNIDYKNLDNNELSKYLDKLNLLILDSANWTKESVANTTFSQNNIDWYYKTLLWYSNGLLTIKWNLDTLIQNQNTITNTYDNQITWLITNLDSLKWNINNLKNNKTESVITWIDVNITNLKSQITSLENGIITQKNNLKSLKDNKQISIKQLDNQILNISQNIDKLNISLSSQNIYAWVNWKISKNFTFLNTNVWANSPICQILEKWENTLKLQIPSANKLLDGYKYSIEKNNNIIFTWSNLAQNPTKNTMTQNYIYEKILKDDYWLAIWDKVNVHIDYPKNELENNIIKNNNIEIPIEYVIPRLNWYFVKKQTNSGTIVEKKIKIWEVNLPNIEVKEWLKYWNILIK